ncbi:hypothetical protein AGDE_09195 [Angomonas deanei]|nr:hypothetical protein AGDE_09195 [Angomonas deanei]|eukprot:EPY31155.1 hypothetical protein AGDE_09195 [Angomonas deanei]
MPEGPVDEKPKKKNRNLDLDPKGPNSLPRAGGMKAGGPVNYIGQHPEYIPDPYKDREDRGRVGRFKAGPIKEEHLPWMPDPEPERQAVEHKGPFLAGKANNSLHINGDMEWIPDPYDKGGVKYERRPFRTWHTRRKWNMPVAAPWSTGLSTVEPRRGENLNLTDTALPQLSTYRRVNMNSTIGKEAALSSMRPPEPVRFKNTF